MPAPLPKTASPEGIDRGIEMDTNGVAHHEAGKISDGDVGLRLRSPVAWSVPITIDRPFRLRPYIVICPRQPQLQAQAASYADLPWWQVFQDPKLQELIRIALKQNYDLQLATERIVAARAELAITRSSLFPQVQGNGNFSGGKENTCQTKYNFLTLTADAAFQLDFFGRLRRATEAARAQLLATEAARQTVILTLVSDVAADYFTLLELDLELQITHDTVKTQIDSVKLTNLRLDHGVATKLDVLQAQQVLDTANAPIPDLERQIAQEEDAISILLGQLPAGCDTRASPGRANPSSRSAAGPSLLNPRAPA